MSTLTSLNENRQHISVVALAYGQDIADDEDKSIQFNSIQFNSLIFVRWHNIYKENYTEWTTGTQGKYTDTSNKRKHIEKQV